MSSAVQPRLPGTLPSPQAARETLIRVKRALTEARATLTALREARKVAAEMLADADDDRATAAVDFEADDTAGASTRYLRAVAAVHEARINLAGARLAVKEARKTVAHAERAREAADEDLIAIDQGRRGN